jgi:hypothetical protein
MQRNDEEAEIKKVKSRKREKDKEDITSGWTVLGNNVETLL